jgi:hypothetical protein
MKCPLCGGPLHLNCEGGIVCQAFPGLHIIKNGEGELVEKDPEIIRRRMRIRMGKVLSGR